MKFCKKCHRMRVGKLVNPNNVNRHCNCDGDMFLSNDVLSRIRAENSNVTSRNERKVHMKMIREIEEDTVFFERINRKIERVNFNIIIIKGKMTDTLLRKLSDKISEVYELDLAEELTDIFVDLTKEIKEDSYRYFNLAKKLAKCEKEKERQEGIVKSYKMAYKAAKEVVDEERGLREKIEKEQIEYDKEYFANELSLFFYIDKESLP